MIALSHITKRYGAAHALKDLSFTAPRGQIIGLLGQNGAGKTTTLNILTGYLPPSSGSVTVGAFDLLTNPRQAKRLMGYLPEKPPLYEEMTVESYLKFCCQLKEVAKKAIPHHVAEILKTTGLTDVARRPLGHLSKGYRQRAGIAQALCGAPEVLVLDEPTVGLDPKQVVEIRSLIKELGKTHTIIFSSHILQEVQQLCQRVIILHEGRMVREVDLTRMEAHPRKYRLSIAMNEKRLAPALKGLPGVTRLKVLPTFDTQVTEAILECDTQELPRRLFTLLTGLDAPILRMTPLADSLEEIFLEATAAHEEVEA
ncbi:MAG: ABC transporter ATP-binding protein [Clostridia bacterium]|nr:ABC transporter ATP-binding protein [Clostridia bacterium]